MINSLSLLFAAVTTSSPLVDLIDWSTLSSLTSEQMISYHEGQRIRLRGFIYKTADGEFIIAPEPNLKSCCLHKSHLIYLKSNQLTVSENIPMEIEGSLELNGKQLFLAEISQPEAITTPLEWRAFLLVATLTTLFFWLWGRLKKNTTAIRS